MFLIDTNTLYYAFGLSNHDSVSGTIILKEILKNDCVKISSISFAEFITKYHKHARIVRKVCAFMRQHHIGIYKSDDIPFENDIIKKLSKIRQKDLDALYETLIILKSTIESRYATAIFFVVLICDTIFECNINPFNVPGCIIDFLSTVFKDSLRPIIQNLFYLSYRNAYKTNDAENNIKRDFYEYLKMLVSLCTPLCNHVIDEYNAIPIGEMVDIPQIINKYSNTDWSREMTLHQKRINRQATPSKFVQKSGLSYGKKINDKHLNALLNGLSNSFNKTINEPSIEEYLFSIVSNTITNGGAFRKNDINDALILSSLQSTDTILSFDNKMIEHMENHSHLRIEYKNSITLISSIKNSI